MQHLLPHALLALLLAAPPTQVGRAGQAPEEEPAQEAARVYSDFEYPCDDYRKGLRGRGNFGVYIDPRKSNSVFADSYHLAEDIWLPGGTEVRSVADGRVVYSDFSPSWTDDKGFLHRNFGNVIVIEHELPPVEGERQWLCSVYVHLSADRRVQVDDEVKRGQHIGFIGKDQSEENGLYPEHLHFGLHSGPYVQISPGWKRELVREARDDGLPCGPEGKIVRGEIEITLLPKATVQIEFIDQPYKTWFSLLVGSTSPDYKPVDIMGWCQGYGDKEMVKEWLRPSTWIAKHKPKK